MTTPPQTGMPTRRLWTVIGAAALIVAVGLATWRLWPRANTFYTDADTIKEPGETAQLRDILWQPPVSLPAAINTPLDDYEPRLSRDGLTLFFVRGRPGENADLFTSRRTPNGWTPAEPLAAVNSTDDELGPEPAPDGQALFFCSNRPGGSGGFDLWVSRRGADGSWQEALSLGPLINSERDEYSPTLSPDGSRLYFASNRPRPDERPLDSGAWNATVRQDLSHRDYDLYHAGRTDRGWGTPQPLAELNTAFNEGTPALSPVGDFLYFSSDRPGGSGGFDLYRARLLDGMPQSPTHLGIAVNTPANELDPGLTSEGYALFFSSDRRDEPAAPERRADYDIYRTSSREVFPQDEMQKASIDWGGLWRALWPNLLWALLALLLILLLWWLMHGELYRKLSLLARCLLMSLMLHLLLLFLFTFWQVTATLADMVRPPGGIRVALLPPSGAADIEVQLRGRLTEFDAPAPRTLETIAAPRDESKVAPLEAQARLETPSEPLTDSRRLSDPTRPVPAPTRPQALEDESASRAPSAEQRLELEVPADSARSRAAETTIEPQRARQATTRSRRPLFREDAAAASEQVTLTPPVRLPAVADPQELLSQNLPTDAPPSVAFPRELAAATADHVARYAPSLITAPQPTGPRNVAEPQTQVTPRLRSAQQAARRTEPAVETSVAVDVPPTSEIAAVVESTLAALPDPSATAAPHPAPQVPFNAAPTRVDPTPAGAALRVPRETESAARPGAHAANRQEPAVAVQPGGWPTQQRRGAERAEPGEPSPELLELEVVGSAEPRRQTSLASEPAMAQAAPVEAGRTPTWAGTPTVIPESAPAPVNVPATSDAAPSPSAGNVDTPIHPPAHHLPAGRAHVNRLSADATTVSEMIALSPANVVTSKGSRSLFEPTAVDDPPMQSATNLSRTPWAATDRLSPRTPDVTVALPDEFTLPETAFPQRRKDQRQDLVERLGGSDETEEAVATALAWLAAHQSQNGRWDADGFDGGCGRCGGEARVDADIAVTGLALLCFMGADHTHTDPGPYRDHVNRALQWLVAQQEEDGDLRGDESMYSHGIAAIALAEAYGMTRDPRLARPVQAAVDFIFQARNRRIGGWRYEPRQAGDTSVLGWQIMALKSARLAGANVPEQAFDVARRWLERVSTTRRRGLYSYRPGRQPTPSMTAEGMFVQQLAGRPTDDPRMRESAGYIAEYLPDWSSKPNTYFWYYATMALFQHQGSHWQEWNEALTAELLKHQKQSGPSAGTWDATDRWSELGGRVYQTALCTLMLEVYYRYLPSFVRGNGSVEQKPDSRPAAE